MELCCDVAVAQINYPSLKHNTQDSIEQVRGRSHEEGSSQIFGFGLAARPNNVGSRCHVKPNSFWQRKKRPQP